MNATMAAKFKDWENEVFRLGRASEFRFQVPDDRNSLLWFYGHNYKPRQVVQMFTTPERVKGTPRKSERGIIIPVPLDKRRKIV